jgi:hypothetical protein
MARQNKVNNTGGNVSTTDASAPASLTQALLAEIIATQ